MSTLRPKLPQYVLEVKALKPFLTLSTDALFKSCGVYGLDYENPIKRRVFVDNKSKVLFVAHMDTVQTPTLNGYSKKCVRAAGLDDRLGVYTAITLVKTLGLKADILITDKEESGQTTAQYHTCKDYNWVCEFDRAGKDVVTYNMDSPEFLEAIKKTWTVGIGSFTDICKLETKACCMNLGIGYEQAHVLDSYVPLKVHNAQINKFIRFFYEYQDTSFVRTNTQPHRRTYLYGNGYNYGGYGGYGYGFNNGGGLHGKRWNYKTRTYEPIKPQRWNFDTGQYEDIEDAELEKDVDAQATQPADDTKTPLSRNGVCCAFCRLPETEVTLEKHGKWTVCKECVIDALDALFYSYNG